MSLRGASHERSNLSALTAQPQGAVLEVYVTPAKLQGFAPACALLDRPPHKPDVVRVRETFDGFNQAFKFSWKGSALIFLEATVALFVSPFWSFHNAIRNMVDDGDIPFRDCILDNRRKEIEAFDNSCCGISGSGHAFTETTDVCG